MFSCIKLRMSLLFLAFTGIANGQDNVAYNTEKYEGNIYNHALNICLNYEKEYFEGSWNILLVHKDPYITTRALPNQIDNTKILVFDFDNAVHYLKKHGKNYFYRIQPLTYSYEDGLFCVSVERRQYFTKKRSLFKRERSLVSSDGVDYRVYYRFEDGQFIFVNIR